jgi:membrane-associated phospholipid phosphatase
MPGLNYNYNYNYNYAAGGGGGGGGRRFRERFNTDYYTRLSVLPLQNGNARALFRALPSPYPLFEPNWDSDLRAYTWLDWFKTRIDNQATADFGAVAGATGYWVTDYKALINAVPLTPPQDMNQVKLRGEITRMLDLSLEREPRFCEIIDQDDGDGAINYLLGMLHIDPVRHPNTRMAVSVGRRIGEFVVMCLKDSYRSPRPSQLSPAITPMFDPPVTPAFPAGHALQAYLIAYLMWDCLPNLPGHEIANPALPLSYTNQAQGLLFDLAARISENRIVAGLHFPEDIEAGIVVALRCFSVIQAIPEWTYLRDQIRNTEFPQYRPIS